MSDRPMTHEERQALIHRPFSFFVRHQAALSWGGSVIDHAQTSRRPAAPVDQDPSGDDEPEDPYEE